PPTPPPAPPPPTGSLQSVNHIIFMAQENRSFDEYFGRLEDYWAANNYAPVQFDGLRLGSTNPGCDPLFPAPMPCTIDPNSRQRPELLLLHGVEFRHLRPLVRAGDEPHADEPHVSARRHFARPCPPAEQFQQRSAFRQDYL